MSLGRISLLWTAARLLWGFLALTTGKDFSFMTSLFIYEAVASFISVLDNWLFEANESNIAYNLELVNVIFLRMPSIYRC